MERLKTEKHVVGLKQSVRAVEEGRASLAFVPFLSKRSARSII